MSEAIDNGGPAFPVSLPEWGDNGASGMTLRDHFAVSASYDDTDLPSTRVACDTLVGYPSPPDDTIAKAMWLARLEARIRYIKADAMLAARNS